MADVSTVVRSPAKIALVLGGNLSTQLLTALSLGAVCRAFGATVPYSTLLLVSIGSSAISGLVPAPGGLGVAEATVMGGTMAGCLLLTIEKAAGRGLDGDDWAVLTTILLISGASAFAVRMMWRRDRRQWDHRDGISGRTPVGPAP